MVMIKLKNALKFNNTNTEDFLDYKLLHWNRIESPFFLQLWNELDDTLARVSLFGHVNEGKEFLDSDENSRKMILDFSTYPLTFLIGFLIILV